MAFPASTRSGMLSILATILVEHVIMLVLEQLGALFIGTGRTSRLRLRIADGGRLTSWQISMPRTGLLRNTERALVL